MEDIIFYFWIACRNKILKHYVTGQADTLDAILEENDQLRAKIEGLNEEYAKIGLEVFNAATKDFFKHVEAATDERAANRTKDTGGW